MLRHTENLAFFDDSLLMSLWHGQGILFHPKRKKRVNIGLLAFGGRHPKTNSNQIVSFFAPGFPISVKKRLPFDFSDIFFYVCKQINLKKNNVMMTFIIVAVVVVLLVMWLVGIYNNLVKLKNNRENAFANIDVQLKQRYDLIPQLVASVKGYADHEKEVLQKVTEARAAAMGATSINDKIQADNALSGALAGLKAVLENYPELKANQNFLQLQFEISDVENKLAAVRRFFNSATKELNTAVETFPSNIFAKMFGFSKQPMFEVSVQDRVVLDKAPEIKF